NLPDNSAHAHSLNLAVSMPFQHISKDIKEHALWLYQHNYLLEDVCTIFGISERSLYRWCHHDAGFGSVIPLHYPIQGHSKKLNYNMTHDLVTLLDEAPDMYLAEIQDWIVLVYNVEIAQATLYENIRDAGLSYKMLQKAASERDEELWAGWRAQNQQHFAAQQIIVVDEISKNECTLFRSQGRAPKSNCATISAPFVQGERYSMVAAIGLNRYVGIHVVEGSVDGNEFFDFIVDDVVSLVQFVRYR
ncbi:hypothetical protein C0992_005003, partial [Termitomyces sp. T32_za158]